MRNTKRSPADSLLTAKFCKVTSVVGALLTLCAGPLNAACDMSTEDNTWHAGLDFNDESSENKQRVNLVERFHFTADVESLTAGNTGELPGDLEYTLASVPNHYRALASYANWEIANPRAAPNRRRTAECYFQRAIGFRPKDPQIRMVFGTFLHRIGRLPEAKTQYESADGMGYQTAELFYDLGLVELSLGNVEAARKHAERAYAMGYPLPGLRNKLNRIKNPKTSQQ